MRVYKQLTKNGKVLLSVSVFGEEENFLENLLQLVEEIKKERE